MALASRLLYNRGIRDDTAAATYLGSATQGLRDPYDLPGVDEAVDAVTRTIADGDRITIFGDFDADGVTGTSILVLALRKLGADVDYYLPLREGDGHGVSANSVREIAPRGTKLIITVDTGVTALDEVRLAQDLGMQTIITDHHIPGDTLPPAVAVINHHLGEPDADLADYSGAGTAYKLATALLHRAGKGDYCDELVALAAVGTIADRSELTGDNRQITKAGLARLDDHAPLGMRALVRSIIDRSRRTEPIDAEFVSFRIAPRLNAPGRLGSADVSVDLLTATDYSLADDLAALLDEVNRKRQTLAAGALDSVREQVDEAISQKRPMVMVELADEYPLGMLGTLAGSLNDETGTPAVAYQIADGKVRGSGRSRGAFNLHEALTGVAHLLTQFGGHSSAAGFQTATSDLDAVSHHLEQQAKWSQLANASDNGDPDGAAAPPNRGQVDATTSFDQLGRQMWTFVQGMGPFGQGNPTPKLLLKEVDVAWSRAVGSDGDTLRGGLRAISGNETQMVGFRLGKQVPLPSRINAVVSLRMNHFRGKVTPELQLHDYEASDEA